MDTQELNPAEKKDLAQKVIFFTVLFVVAMCGSMYYIGPMVIKPVAMQEQQKIVVLNVPKLVGAYTKQIMSNEKLTPAQMSELSSKVAQNLHDVAVSYRDHGYIVLNGAYAVTWPGALDITKKTADQLGVKF